MTMTEAIAQLARSPGVDFHLDLAVRVSAAGRVRDVEWTYWERGRDLVQAQTLDGLVVVVTGADTLSDLDATGVGDIAKA